MSSGNFVFRFFGAIWRGVNGVRKILHLLLLLFVFMIFFGAFSEGPPKLLPQKAALVVQPVGQLVEQIAGDPYDRAIAEFLDDAPPQTLVSDVVEAHGDVGLSGGYGLWGQATGATIYPDLHPTIDDVIMSE